MIKRLMIILILCLFNSGCGLNAVQRESVTRFASASTGLGKFSAKELTAWRDITIQMNSKDIAMGGIGKLNDLDGAFNPDDVQARIHAAQALTAYGHLLSSLVGSNNGELKNAALQFEDSIKGVSDKNLSNNQLDILGSVVYNIGGLFVEWQKAKALKEIVLQTKPDIDKLCDLLITDFDPRALNLAQAIANTSNRLKGDADITLSASSNIQDKLIAIDAYKLADEQKSRLKKIAAYVVETLKVLKSANTELANALENDSETLDETKLLGIKMKELALALQVSGH